MANAWVLKGATSYFSLVMAIALTAEGAGGAYISSEAGFAGGSWYQSWEINGQEAIDAGPADGSIQVDVHWPIVQFKARLPNQAVVDIRKAKIQMNATSDVAIEQQGSYLRWYLGTSLLECDEELGELDLPSEFFAAMVDGNSLKVIRADVPTETWITAEALTIELDGEDLGCP